MAPTSEAGPIGAARVGLIGYGTGGASFHAPFIDATPGLELVAVVTTDVSRQAAVRRQHPAAEIVASVDQLLAAPDLDLVVVSTPNHTHVPLASAVLRSDRHVVVDKPLAPTADQARALRELAAGHGRRCIPFHNRRWDGDFRTVQDLVTRGRLGRLWRLEVRWERWRPHVDTDPGRRWKDDPTPGSAGGVLFDLGPHVVDQALQLLGRPELVHAELATRRTGARSTDDAFLALTFPDGAIAHLTTSLDVGRPLPRFRAVGSEATYVGTATMDPQEQALAAGRRPDEPGWGAVDESAWGTLGAGDQVVPVPTLPGDYGAFYRAVASTVLNGADPPVGIDDGITVLEVLEAAVRSATDGQVVRLDG